MPTNNSANLAVSNGMHATISSGNYTLSNLRNVSKYVVSSVSGQGGYTTIQSAINQAVTDGASSTTPAVIYIWPGTYSETITLSDNVNLLGSLDGSVFIIGSMSYSSGSVGSQIENLTITSASSTDTISVTAAVSFTIENCSIFNTSTGKCLTVNNSNASVFAYNSFVTASASAVALNITSGTADFYYCNIQSLGTASQISGGIGCFYCICSDSFTLASSTATGSFYFNEISSGSNQCFSVTNATATATCVSCLLDSSATYFAGGSGNFVYSDLILSGTSVTIDPSLGIAVYEEVSGKIHCTNLTVNSGIVTAPSNSSSSTLSLGTAYQNTSGADILVTVYLSVSTATSADILLGVGTTSTPTQQTIISGLTLSGVDIISVPIYIPNNYYALLSTSGTITSSISGQIQMGV